LARGSKTWLPVRSSDARGLTFRSLPFAVAGGHCCSAALSVTQMKGQSRFTSASVGNGMSNSHCAATTVDRGQGRVRTADLPIFSRPEPILASHKVIGIQQLLDWRRTHKSQRKPARRGRVQGRRDSLSGGGLPFSGGSVQRDIGRLPLLSIFGLRPAALHTIATRVGDRSRGHPREPGPDRSGDPSVDHRVTQALRRT
jgi:hypothetical protein